MAVVVGTAQIRVRIPDSRSLKDKRRIINALKDRLRSRFNVSIAEVDGQDLWQLSTLAVAQVSNDSRYVNGSLEKLVDAVRRFRGAELVDYTIDIF